MEKKSKFVAIPVELAKEFCVWSRPKSFCNSGTHVVDRLSGEIERQLNENKSNNKTLRV